MARTPSSAAFDFALTFRGGGRPRQQGGAWPLPSFSLWLSRFVSGYRVGDARFVSGYRFSDTTSSLNQRPPRGGVDTLVILQKRVAGLNQLTLGRFVARARRAAGLKGIVNILITTSAEMKSLNRRFRGKDKPTDVLSFPADPKVQKQLAGEIAISAEIATKNARSLGHSPAEEVKILVLHGILHLRGYDHECDNGQMARREKQLRAKLDLPLGLIERATSVAQRKPTTSRTKRNQPQ